ncbi:uncharacterized protein LOC117169639 [Belonocnema kinseyi]|uniref:uncharacterized protein LOC117169639 n=1 Tax=Belonocnema kinseyi TaxID=2817044 RepID=UPI00143D9087|nr:uncharacterized protein LOC117169639 [Belonocnema kinseyi]
MWDSSTYLGNIRSKPSTYVPWFLKPNPTYQTYVYYIRTEEGGAFLSYASTFKEQAPPQSENHDFHKPRHCSMKIGDTLVYTALNFREYDVNLRNHASPSENFAGNFPAPNFLYIAIPRKGIYRARLQ